MTRYEKNRKEFDIVLSELFQYTAKELAEKRLESVDVIATTALHENWSAEKIAEIDSHFLNTHIKKLEKQTKFFLWKDWINKLREGQYQAYYEEIVALSKNGSEWHKLMEETHANTLASIDLESSIRYQRQEYTAIRCMKDYYTDIVYMGSISQGWSYLYTLWPGLPRFVRASINSQIRPIKNSDASYAINLITLQVEDAISNPSISPKEKKKLIDNCFTLFRTYEPKLSMSSRERETPQLLPSIKI